MRATVAGGTLEYVDAGAGEPVVCIHGAFIADAFRPLLAERSLASRYRLIAYHRRGYAGSSPAEGPVSLAQQTEDCRSLLFHLGVERAHVVGHSFGGLIGIHLALDAPELVHTLSLLEAALPIGDTADQYRQGLVQGMERYREAGARVTVAEFLEARWPEYREHLELAVPGAFEQAVADAATCFSADLPAVLDFRIGRAEAARIAQPVLAVLGERSAALNPRFPEVHRLLLEWLPHAEGFVLPGATHFLQGENPHDMADALAAFFARHPLEAGTG
jgi:pimeloyl-ACP methyl ester carboxylesterase